jgi:cytochrome c-type biogenesis protein CcmH/NrfG
MSQLDALLAKWHNAKQELSLAETNVKKYRDRINGVMDDKAKNELRTENFSVSRRTISKETVSKSDLPADIWGRYASKSVYTALYLKKE